MGNKTFANDPAEWILGRTATEELTDASGTRVRMTRSYYDGEAFKGLPLGKLTRGDLTRQEAWVGPGLEEFDDVAMSKYDAHGNVLETRDARGGGRRFEWDAAGIAVVAEHVETGTLTLTQRAQYDARIGAMVRFWDFGGAATSFGYDGLGRLVRIARPGDSEARPTVAYKYELAAPLSRITTTKRIESGSDSVTLTVAAHDGLGRQRAAFLEDDEDRWVVSGIARLDSRGETWRTVRAEFVADASKPLEALASKNQSDDSWRDALGRTVATRTWAGRATRTVYAPLETRNWDAAQNDPTSDYEHAPVVDHVDGIGRTTRRDWLLGGATVSIHFAWDAAGELVSRTDPEGHVTSYKYDGRGRRVAVTDPDAGSHQFSFNASDDMVEHRYPDGKVSLFEHDLTGRTQREDWDGDGVFEVERVYDGDATSLAQLSRVSDPSGSTRYTYDDRGRLIKRDIDAGGKHWTTGYGYDAQDRETMHHYPDGSSVRLHYSRRGLVARIGRDAVTFHYDADGSLMQRDYAPGVRERFGYDADRRVTGHEVTGLGGTIAQHLAWTLDGVGNVVEEKDLRPGIAKDRSRSVKYVYDNLYRMVHASGTWGETTWQYSGSGRLLSRASTDASIDAGTFQYESKRPHAVTGVRGRKVVWDARGRLVSDGERQFEWNGADRVQRVTSKNGSTLENTYDGDGARRTRVERSLDGSEHVTHFIDDWSEVQDGELARYLVVGGQRLARLAPDNGRPEAGAAPVVPTAPTVWKKRLPDILVLSFDRLLVAIMILAGLSFGRHRLVLRCRPAPRTTSWRRGAWALGALAVLVGACAGEKPQPRQSEGSIVTLTDADTLLLGDRVGSLTETLSGSGGPRGSSANYPYGASRFDDTQESRVFAGTVRDRGVGLDLMGARFYAPDLAGFASVDPEWLGKPEALLDAEPAHHAYGYGNANPATYVDSDGNHPAAAAVVAIAAGIGVLITTQYANAPTLDKPQLMHKGTAELALDMAHNATVAVSVVSAPGAVGGVVKQAVKGGVTGALKTSAKAAAVGAAHQGAKAGADKLDPSGNAGKVVDIAAAAALSRTRSCFTGDTTVVMCDGTRLAIADVQTGDEVVARDVADGTESCRRVLHKSITPGRSVVDLEVRSATGTTEHIRATAEHPFWVEGSGWITVGELALGSGLATADGTFHTVVSVSSSASLETVFNLEVEQLHTYFVGSSRALVHNAPACGAGGRTPKVRAAERVDGGVKKGRVLTEKQAVERLKRGQDVHTDSAARAKSLAKKVAPGKPIHDEARQNGHYDHYHDANREGGHAFHGEPKKVEP